MSGLIEAIRAATSRGARAAHSADALDVARREAALEKRARIAAIFSLENAKDREDLATHLALETDMSPEMADLSLSHSPKTRGLLAEMKGFKQAALGADGGAGSQMNDYQKGAHEARMLLGK